MGNVERRLDRTEPRGEIAIERIAAVTSAEYGFDQRLIRVKERGVRLEKQVKAHTAQTQQNFDSLMGRTTTVLSGSISVLRKFASASSK